MVDERVAHHRTLRLHFVAVASLLSQHRLDLLIVKDSVAVVV
jgi:hypothetical protein